MRAGAVIRCVSTRSMVGGALALPVTAQARDVIRGGARTHRFRRVDDPGILTTWIIRTITGRCGSG